MCPTLYVSNDIASTVCGDVPDSKTHLCVVYMHVPLFCGSALCFVRAYIMCEGKEMRKSSATVLQAYVHSGSQLVVRAGHRRRLTGIAGPEVADVRRRRGCGGRIGGGWLSKTSLLVPPHDDHTQKVLVR